MNALDDAHLSTTGLSTWERFGHANAYLELAAKVYHPRALQNVSAIDLVEQRVEPTPGIGLGRPVKRML